MRPFSGDSHIFVARLSPNAELRWNTFLGTPASDAAGALAVTAQQQIILVGRSQQSWGTPRRSFSGAAQAAAVVVALNEDGELAWHTFLGAGGQHLAQAVALDSAGNIYVAGGSTQAWGTPRRRFGGAGYGYVACLAPDGSLRWHTFLGGSAFDAAHGLAVAPEGGLFVVGTSRSTWGEPLRPRAGETDAFAVHLDGQGNAVWSTFLGGDGEDTANAVALDAVAACLSAPPHGRNCRNRGVASGLRAGR